VKIGTLSRKSVWVELDKFLTLMDTYLALSWGF